MQVLLVTPDYPPPPGGIQTVTVNLETGLREQGHEVEVLQLDPGDRNWSNIRIPKKRWIYGYSSLTTGDSLFFENEYQRSLAKIKKYKPDIVHCLHIKNLPALVAANECNVPSVLTIHALELENKSLADRSFDYASVVHSVSEYTENISGIPPRKSRYIAPPSIDVESYQTEAKYQSGGPLSLISIARMVDRKNMKTVVESVKSANEQGLECTLTIIGDGPNRASIEEMTRDLPFIEVLGWVKEEEKNRRLRKSDIFILTPLKNGYDVEGFGIVYIEAQASGTPVIGSNNGGIPEAVGNSGILIDDPLSHHEIISAIRQYSDDSTREKYTKNAEDRVVQFGLSSVSNIHIRNYIELL